MDVDDLYRVAGDDAVVLQVHVQPGAGRTAMVGRHGAALKVRVAAPPEGNRANEACASLFAEIFGVPGAAIELVNGRKSRSKQFQLSGLDIEEFRRRLERAVEDGLSGPGPEGRPGRR